MPPGDENYSDFVAVRAALDDAHEAVVRAIENGGPDAAVTAATQAVLLSEKLPTVRRRIAAPASRPTSDPETGNQA